MASSRIAYNTQVPRASTQQFPGWGDGSQTYTPPMASRQTGSSQIATFGNKDGSPEYIPTHTIFVDSRDRDRYSYPNPNTFTMKLTHPLKTVRRIKLVEATIPILNTVAVPPQPIYKYLVVVERHCYNSINQPAIAGQFPRGALAIIDLLPHTTNVPGYTIYKDNGAYDLGWIADFPAGLDSLDSLQLELWVWGWNTGPPGSSNPILYPLLNEAPPVNPALPVPAADPLNNYTLTFKIFNEH